MSRLFARLYANLPHKLRWSLRSGPIGFIRDLIKEIRFYFYEDPSQFGEQEVLLTKLTQSHGTYVDVGAGKPISGSNTFFLYKRGWKGICLEPIRKNRYLHRIFRPRDCFLPFLCGKGETIKFFEFSPYEYSTTVERVAEDVCTKYGEGVKLISIREIKSTSLAKVLQEQKLDKVDFLNIDTEGSDLLVLRSLDWEATKPGVIAVEAWVDSEEQVKDFLTKKGYSLIATRGLTFVFSLNGSFDRNGGGGGI